MWQIVNCLASFKYLQIMRALYSTLLSFRLLLLDRVPVHRVLKERSKEVHFFAGN
jgi:hypothetical protein